MPTDTTDKEKRPVKRLWSAADEAAFQRMATEREQLTAKQREPVKAAVHWIILDIQRSLANDVGLGSVTAREKLIDGLIARAGMVRDALEPFDSNDRPAAEEPPAPQAHGPGMANPAPKKYATC